MCEYLTAQLGVFARWTVKLLQFCQNHCNIQHLSSAAKFQASLCALVYLESLLVWVSQIFSTDSEQ